MEDVLPERNKMQPFCSFSDFLKTGNLVPRRATISLSGEKNQPAARNTQDQYPRYQDERKQLTKGPTSFSGFFSVEGRRVGKDFKREFKDLSAVKGFFSHYTSPDAHSSGVTASIEAAKISILHPTFVGV